MLSFDWRAAARPDSAPPASEGASAALDGAALDSAALDSAALDSAAWAPGGSPLVAVAISTFRRARYLPGLLAALEAQSLGVGRFEVVMVDNASGDDTWPTLVSLVSATTLRMRVARRQVNRGPAGGRNQAVALSRAPLVAFTDDDCLPAPGWLEAVASAFSEGVDVVQGRVQAEQSSLPQLGPWGHTIWVTGPTPFYEACNVAYRRSAFQAVGGFDENDPLTAQAGGRAFGEDACLAWRVQQAGGRAVFVGAAVVEHRCTGGRFCDRLADHRHLRGFPGLAKRSPLVSAACWHRVFHTRQSAAFDLALGCVIGGLATKRAVLVAGALPWLVGRWPQARAGAAGSRAMACWRLAQLATVDLVSFLSLAEGSIRHRRLML